MKQIQHYLITLLLAIMPVVGLHAQNKVVTFPSGTMTVRQAFEAIEHQLGMTIAYNESLLDVNRHVTPPSGKHVLEAMTAILDGTGMQARIDGKMILVVKADQKATPVEYKGKVVDSSGPVPGAMVMLDGKKGVAQKVVYGAFDIIKEKTGKDANEVFQAALANVAPSLEVKARRVGGATYQVPIEIRPERRQIRRQRRSACQHCPGDSQPVVFYRLKYPERSIRAVAGHDDNLH